MMRISIQFVLLFLFSLPLYAQSDQFKPGPVIKDHGMIAAVPGMVEVASDSVFKISFDLAQKAQWGGINRGLDTAARFINMHVANGIDENNIKLALVIHGGAVKDMVKNNTYRQLNDNEKQASNSNAGLIKTLQEHGVKLTVCGQSAVYYGIKAEDLLPGVTLSLSAMTAHALLQSEGYTLNPF
ncbi:DsrE family protein [Marinicella marina]|uniref:DsrE family protein n=1 Tax=Marinicella marina TaxID=2996016 RepID=UPI0022609EF7|nr:DsrE family protein [Marinicella marina]MDJ1140633.1 DsrE family protein [Marinicella marina]